jgi:hypothetical protein
MQRTSLAIIIGCVIPAPPYAASRQLADEARNVHCTEGQYDAY